MLALLDAHLAGNFGRSTLSVGLWVDLLADWQRLYCFCQ
jgi:hypothetical protein